MAPQDLRYTKDHEWVRLDGDVATIGITDFAAHQLGDIVFVELPDLGRAVTQFGPIGVVESVKAVSDLYSPVDGEVTAVNADVNLEHLADDPYQAGWFIKIKISNPAGLADLLDAAAYKKQCEEEPH